MSRTIINVSYGNKIALSLGLCQCEIKMASKMAAKIIKKIFLVKGQFLQYYSFINDVYGGYTMQEPRMVPFCHPWANRIIQDGVQEGCHLFKP